VAGNRVRGWIAVWGHLVAAGGESALFVFFAAVVFRPRFPGEIRQLVTWLRSYTAAVALF